MSEEPTIPPGDEPPLDLPPQPEVMPGWIPLLLGVVLVAMASLAVFTGLRYRESPLAAIARPVRAVRDLRHTAPPGEPEAGASLMFPGDGSNVPTANEPVGGKARAEIVGGPGQVQSTIRMWARRGMTLEIVPQDAVVYVNDLPIGQASQFNSQDEIYDFAEPGSYTIKVVAPGYQDRQFIVTAAENAKDDVARIVAKLEKN